MEQESKIPDPESVYRQSADKQRLVITGGQSEIISSIVVYILTCYHREFDYIIQTPEKSKSTPRGLSDAPLIIIQECERPTPSILQYRHHIGVIGDISPLDEPVFRQFADATPKGGIIIYSDNEPVQTIGKKERPGTTSLAYKANLHVVENGQVILISSHQERFPIHLSGAVNLRNINAAKEILKKIGITSEQFYHAVTGFEG